MSDATDSSPDRGSGTLITARRVITDPEREPLEQGGVLLRDGVVAAVGPASELERTAGAVDHLEFPMGTVIPGLINAHLHLAFDVTTDPRTALEAGDADAVRATIAANARAALDGGVTTARDLGDQAGLVAAFGAQAATGDVAGPRLLSAMSPLTTPGGHCWFLGGEIDTSGDDAERVVRAAVDERADAGADLIKIMASGGHLTPTGAPMWQSQFGDRDLAVVVEAAHERGLPVAGHAHGTEAMARCARAGVDTIEHGGWQAPPGADGKARHDLSPEVADLVAASGAAIVPTRARGWESWTAEAGLELQLEKFAWDAERGIPLIAGNDAGVGQGYFDDLVDAITLFEAAGWSRAQALATATTRAAAAVGQAHHVGRLETGHSADLVVLDADPLADLHALRKVRLVVVRGRQHVPS
ncbi:amidohydrolase family protein [Actinomycetospora endophytica]|uniref:Amidohydrolase family protein n=1 Tax=Actinomycetospora endophytica TaxID=2291215 RepID=A0ABS8PAW7_9PSEU|nr:amidohydrolase family protein [Actinomycetospora endophytica]MCD2195390.1 amidohydrolase family protein [Actinomycetospora endophytica]